MRSLTIAVLCGLSLVGLGFAQPGIDLYRTYDNGLERILFDAISTSDQGYLLIGIEFADTSRYHGDPDVSIVKLDDQGDVQWQRSYGEFRDDYEFDAEDVAYCGIETDDNCYLIGGRWYSDNYLDPDSHHDYPYLIKIDNEGDVVWFQDYPDLRNVDMDNIYQIDDGSFYIGDWNRLFHIDENGEILREILYDDNFRIHSVVNIKYSDDIMLTAYSIGADGWSDISLMRIRQDGEEVWRRDYHHRGEEYLSDVNQTDDGGLIITGGNTNRDLNAQVPNMFILKVDSLGDEEWFRIYQREGLYKGNAIVQSQDLGYTVSSVLIRLPIDCTFIEKVNCDGDLLWTIEPDSAGTFFPEFIDQTEDRSYIVFGWEPDIYLYRGAKTEPDPVSVPRIINPALPDRCQLNQPYPNPFNSTVNISFTIPVQGDVDLLIFNNSGRRVTELIDRTVAAGEYRISWDAGSLVSGRYYCRLRAGHQDYIKEIILIK